MVTKRIRTSLLWMIILVVALLSLTLAIAGFHIYRINMIRHYQNYAGDTIDCIARQIDGDDMERCIATGTKSKAYDRIQLLANDFKETHDLLYIYIIKPLKIDPPHNMMDVLAATTAWERDNEADTLTDLGVVTDDAYPADVAEQYMARMDHDPTVTFFRNDTDFGDIYTAIRPIFNGKGEPIAVICGDIMIDDITGAALNYALAAFLASLAFSAWALLLISLWIERRIAGPLGRLQRSASDFEEKCRSRADLHELTMGDPLIRTGDEIQALSDSIVSMVQDVQAYAHDLIAKDNEIVSMKEHVNKMDVLAYRDTLTGAGNKAAYEKATGRLEWDILAGNAHFAIVVTDLNYLKHVNDSYGHDKGDEYLRSAYNLMREVFVDSPIFRVGGDEFAVIVQHEELARCTQLIDELKRRAWGTMQDSSLDPWQRVSLACGYASYEPGNDVAAVFAQADANMYEDKRRMHAQR
ncbi:MAG: GGDEF domain-containing protein [Atopobiaceae bacterium]|nr:GGDEF domain-containing protein [Atopobiaceae bacterium]